MEIAGYIASVLIGLSLGIIGGGGSILTVPVLVYLLGVEPVLATAYSLFIVGATSLLGSVTYLKRGEVHLKAAVIFGLPSILSVYLTRAYLLPAIPERVASIGGWTLGKGHMILLIFALLMLLAAYSMIRPSRAQQAQKGKEEFNVPLIFAEGMLVGALTGLVGAGGGFLIIPALVLLSRLPMKLAVGSSLLIIAAKSLVGFFAAGSLTPVNWPFLLSITALAFIGMLAGSRLSRKVSGERLKPVFGWFVLLMGLYIIIRELFL